MSLNIQDYSLISTILNNFTIVFIQLFSSKEYDKIHYEINSKIIGLFDIFYEIFSFCAKYNNFTQNLVMFIDCFNNVCNYIEFKIIDSTTVFLTSNTIILLELVNLLLNNHNKSKKTGNVNPNTNNKTNNQEMPEFILISCCKVYILYNHIDIKLFIFEF